MEKLNKILIVDDERFNINVLSDLLKPTYKIMAAINGQQALKAARSANPPDLILLDVMMPEIDGYEVCRQLKADESTRTIPIIFVTAMGEESDETKGLELGAADYILKPVSPPILEARVKTHLALRKHMSDLQQAYSIIKAQKDRMETELNVGREIQMSLVPQVFPAFPDRQEIDLDALLEPAREVGGDLYDYYFLDRDNLCFCIGDVSGKGVPAALFMAITKTLIKSRSVDDYSTASIVTHLNDELSEDNTTSMFVTLFLAILHVPTGEFVYTNAGHNPTMIKRVGGEIETLTNRHGPIVGAMPGLAYKEDRVTLHRGDLMLLYTDGVTEAMNPAGDLYSDSRLASLVGQAPHGAPHDLVASVLKDVVEFESGAERADDITIVSLKYSGIRTDTQDQRFYIEIKNDLKEIDRVNEEFHSFLESAGVSVAFGYKFSVVFDELLNNTISYAYTDDAEHAIAVEAEIRGDNLVVTIIDDGMPYNPFTRPAPDTSLSLEEREIGGLGVHLVRNLVEDVGYQRKTNTNVITLTHRLQSDDRTRNN